MDKIKFKEIRLAKKMTQKELADWLGVDRQAVYRYEKGSKIPGPVVRLMYYIGNGSKIGI